MTNHCPLVTVSDHGRLIDADAVRNAFLNASSDGDKVEFCLSVIDIVPTIIPANKETPCEDCPYDECSIPKIGSCDVADKDGAE